ncbi:hypothetical protein M1N17_03145, partial [Dehalococcoidia bacterium]|nr:hypothetical protein [Dehalococcoidia bacterium]
LGRYVDVELLQLITCIVSIYHVIHLLFSTYMVFNQEARSIWVPIHGTCASSYVQSHTVTDSRKGVAI